MALCFALLVFRYILNTKYSILDTVFKEFVFYEKIINIFSFSSRKKISWCRIIYIKEKKQLTIVAIIIERTYF